MNAIAWLIDTVFSLINTLLIIYIVLGWLVSFNVVNNSNRFVYMIGQSLSQLLEPMLRPIRRFLPAMGGLDFSPIVLLLALHFLRIFILADIFPALFG